MMFANPLHSAALAAKAIEVAQDVREYVEALPTVKNGLFDVPQIDPWGEVNVDVNFQTPMGTSNYSVVLSLANGGAQWASLRTNIQSGSFSTSGFSVIVRNDSDAISDPAKFSWIAVG